MLSPSETDHRYRPAGPPPPVDGSYASLDDVSLMRAVQARDERAFATLYDRRASALLAVILRIVPERLDAESILLETFTQAWRDAERYSPARSPVLAWLLMIARSRALDHSRSVARTLRLMPVSVEFAPDAALAADSESSDPSRSVEEKERSAIVATAMATLTPLQRNAIELAFFEGLSHSEIAERLAEPLGTVKSRIRLAMARLRSALHPSSRELAT